MTLNANFIITNQFLTSEATIFKMAANTIVKLSMVSDFNEKWYLGLFWSEELIGNDEKNNPRYQSSLKSENSEIFPILSTAIHSRFFLVRIFYQLYLKYLPNICPTKFSETDDPIFTKPHRKVDPHLKRGIQDLEFSKWPLLPWKPWTYVKIFYLTYTGNCQRDFHKIWQIF
jgi:hypothetical protein